MRPTRRQYVLGIGVAVAGIGAGNTVLGGTHPDALVFEEVNRGAEYVVIRNTGDESVDLSGYYMEFELGQQQSQTSPFPDGTTIEPGGTLKVASGAEPVEDADVTFDYERGEIRNDGSDTLAILEPDEETVVIRSDEDFAGQETPTATETPTETAEETPTETEETPTETEDESPTLEEGSFVAELSGEGHGIDTSATGRAEFDVDVDAEEVHYTLEVSELCDATMAHIHLGGEGESGPVVVWLYPTDQQEPRTKEGRFTGTLAEGTFTEDDLVGPLEGKSFEELAETHAGGEAYVNVHTEDHPGGEIRGQIEPTG